MFLYNNGNENVPIYVGCEDAVNPNPVNSVLGVLIRFKTRIPIKLLGWIIPQQCVQISMHKHSVGFLKVISIAELYNAHQAKDPRHIFKQIVPR
jgi:hypothetical protein